MHLLTAENDMSGTGASWILDMPMKLPQSAVVFLESVDLVGSQVRNEELVVLFYK
jgi:hypothetical protein